MERQSNHLKVKKRKRNKSGSIQKAKDSETKIQKQIDKKKLFDFDWHEDVPDNLKVEIKEILVDLKKRRDYLLLQK